MLLESTQESERRFRKILLAAVIAGAVFVGVLSSGFEDAAAATNNKKTKHDAGEANSQHPQDTATSSAADTASIYDWIPRSRRGEDKWQRSLFLLPNKDEEDPLVETPPPTGAPTNAPEKPFTDDNFKTKVQEFLSGGAAKAAVEAEFGLIEDWNVGQVTDFSEVFLGAGTFNEDIGEWDVSQGTTFASMFEQARQFNQNIGGWDVGRSTSFLQMFEDADNFNQNLGDWKVGNSLQFRSMFNRAVDFAGEGLGAWDVSSATDVGFMFNDANAFNEDIGDWVVSNVVIFKDMFRFTDTFDQDLSRWDVSKGTDLSEMFRNAAKFNRTLCSWVLTSATSVARMFEGTDCPEKDDPDLGADPVTPLCFDCTPP